VFCGGGGGVVVVVVVVVVVARYRGIWREFVTL
jgi:uncharacterized membrane protein required for colicin V production